MSTVTLCCWCDQPATGKPVRYAGTDHPACPEHSRLYRAPITYSNEDFDRINHAIRLPVPKEVPA